MDLRLEDAESHLAGEDEALARRFGWFPRAQRRGRWWEQARSGRRHQLRRAIGWGGRQTWAPAAGSDDHYAKHIADAALS